MDVDSLFRSVFQKDTFFEIVGAKIYEDFRDFTIEPWALSAAAAASNNGQTSETRLISYDLSKSVAFTKQTVHVQQSMVR